MACVRNSSGMGAFGEFYSKEEKAHREGIAKHKGAVEPDFHQCPPSKVVHMRGLPIYTHSSDLTQVVSAFGNVRYVVMMSNNTQALVELDNEDQAHRLVHATRNTSVYVSGQRVYAGYSKCQVLERDIGPAGANKNDHQPTKVLLLTILNPLRSITADVLYTVCSPFGKVLRIVIFRKHGVQSMIEFDSHITAQRARTALNNSDVYGGCCTLKIEYSAVTRLYVRANGSDTVDYTKTNRRHSKTTPAYRDPHRQNIQSQEFSSSTSQPQAHESTKPAHSQSASQHIANGSTKETVLTVTGIDGGRATAETLHSLFGVYGGVLQAKILPLKQSTGIVHMTDSQSAARARHFLNNAPMFGGRLNITLKSTYDAEGPQIHTPQPPKTAPGINFSATDWTNPVVKHSSKSAARGLEEEEGERGGGGGNIEERQREKNELIQGEDKKERKKESEIEKHTEKNRSGQGAGHGDGERQGMGDKERERERDTERKASQTYAPPSCLLSFRASPHLSTAVLIQSAVVGAGAAVPVEVTVHDKARDFVSGTIQYGSVEEAVEAVALANHVTVRNHAYPPAKNLRLAFSSDAPY